MIIGWDDSRGAWLCYNSWRGGPNGDQTFYMSYKSSTIQGIAFIDDIDEIWGGENALDALTRGMYIADSNGKVLTDIGYYTQFKDKTSSYNQKWNLELVRIHRTIDSHAEELTGYQIRNQSNNYCLKKHIQKYRGKYFEELRSMKCLDNINVVEQNSTYNGYPVTNTYYQGWRLDRSHGGYLLKIVDPDGNVKLNEPYKWYFEK